MDESGISDALDAPVCRELLQYIKTRIQEDKPVKEYLDLHDMVSFDRLMQALHAVETNKESCYIREFSIGLFHDSKAFEQIKGKVIKALRTFGENYSDREEKEILAEYGIYHTPDYVYLKGAAKVRLAGEALTLGGLKQGVGISGDDLENLEIAPIPVIKRVLTIENQTTFFRWQEPETLIVYLGGYHNTIRRSLLQKIHQAFPKATYHHFGDMDAGGFEIYRDLKEKTGLPFEPYYMDRETLKTYRGFARPLTDSDRKRLQKMDIPEFSELISYMLQENIKLEQETICSR